ncbi:hypothetical protein EYF80_004933 [Liparis tanakae]|uniref:Uncharacterized protein n=1 Tax=Liparis tanakae TaxID=230148 RepID=A0A4Z2J5G2_9TELE|nr:hypothetical protein EYF80_004933 [Liparis tanakae]
MAYKRPADSIPVVFILTDKFRVVQRLRHTADGAGCSPKASLKLSLWHPAFGFLVERVEVLSGSGEIQQSNKRRQKQPQHEDKGAADKAHYSSSLSHATRLQPYGGEQQQGTPVLFICNTRLTTATGSAVA